MSTTKTGITDLAERFTGLFAAAAADGITPQDEGELHAAFLAAAMAGDAERCRVMADDLDARLGAARAARRLEEQPRAVASEFAVLRAGIFGSDYPGIAEAFAAAEAAGDLGKCLELAELATRHAARPRGSAPHATGDGRNWTFAELQEKQRREDEAARRARRDAAERAEIEAWKARGAREIIAEIERDRGRRLFLAEDGRVMVRGRGTASVLRAALQHHESNVRAILADRDAVEELIPPPAATERAA